MDIVVRGKHFEVPPLAEERARLKLGRLAQYLPLLEDASVEVDIAHEKAKQPDKRFVVHVIISAHGVHLQAEERAAKLELAIDQVARALSQQARRHKERLYDRGRSKAAKEPPEPKIEREEPLGLLKHITKVKRFPIKPMTSAEALEQMEMLKHDFFIFHDAEANQFALVYRRKAGDYGIIVPELS